MKKGKTLEQLVKELDRQRESIRDFKANTSEITALTSPESHITELHLPNGEEFPVNDFAHTQIASRLKIPKPYYDRLREKHPAILDANVNGLFRREPENRMIRTLDGKARAFVSEKFRRIDNYPIMETVLPILGAIPNVRFEDSEITERRLYLKVVIPGLQGHLRDLITGEHKFLANGDPDYVQMGLVLTNSEVGAGAFDLSLMLYRLGCLNGLIIEKALRKYHVGAAIQSESVELFEDDTVAADQHALMLKLRDVVTHACTEAQFQALVHQFEATTAKPGIDTDDPIKGVQELGKARGLTEAESNGVLQHILAGGDLSAFGLINAVTRTAQDVESYDRSVELERLGGDLLAEAVAA